MNDAETPVNKEGWTWLMDSRRWHYFREGRSLCNCFLLWGKPELEQGENDSPSNCAVCKRKLAKEIAQNDTSN
jgi:hypothetical protein